MSIEEQYREISRSTGIPEFKLKEMTLDEIKKIFRALINSGRLKMETTSH